MTTLNLVTVAGDEIRVLIGIDRGEQARGILKLDLLDIAPEPVVVTAPAHLKTLTPSFVQGLFAGSVHRLGEEEFFRHYRFEVPETILQDVRAGVDRILTSRHIAGA
jgi:hypothetical protein